MRCHADDYATMFSPLCFYSYAPYTPPRCFRRFYATLILPLRVKRGFAATLLMLMLPFAADAYAAFLPAILATLMAAFADDAR